LVVERYETPAVPSTCAASHPLAGAMPPTVFRRWMYEIFVLAYRVSDDGSPERLRTNRKESTRRRRAVTK
jgi:hypothetical protein